MIHSLTFNPAASTSDILAVDGASVLDEWDTEFAAYAHVAFRGHTFRVAGSHSQNADEAPAPMEIKNMFVHDEREGHVDENASRELAAVQLVTAVAMASGRHVHAEGWWSVDDGLTKRGDLVLSPDRMKAACSALESGALSINYFGHSEGYYG